MVYIFISVLLEEVFLSCCIHRWISEVLPDTFRRFWYFVASVCFRSTEGLAVYLNEDAAVQKLATLPLLPLSQKQRGMIGEARVRESFQAQKSARGISEAAEFRMERQQSLHFCSNVHSNSTRPASTWATHIVQDVASATVKTGNHVCRPDVCHKGRIGKMGFCRMFYWHWAIRVRSPF